MKRKNIKGLTLVALLAGSLLVSCNPSTSSQTPSSTLPPSSEGSSISTPSEATETYGVVIVPDSYGTITTDKDSYAVGETVTITVTAKDADNVVADTVTVNETEVEVGIDGTATTTMVENGLVLKANYRQAIDDFTVSSDFNSITVTPIANAEYKLDDGEFQDNNVFTDLEEGTTYQVSVRIKAKGLLRASSTLTKSVATKSTAALAQNVVEQLQMLDYGTGFSGSFKVQRFLDGAFYDETLFDNELYYAADHYYLKSDFADDGTEKLYLEYAPDENGNAQSVRLNYDNTLLYTPLDSNLDFYDTYGNPFYDLEASDLTLLSDGRYSLDIQKLTDSQEKRIFKFLTTYELPLNSFFITLDADGKIQTIDAYATNSSSTPGMDGTGSYNLVLEEEIVLTVADPSTLSVALPQEKSFNKTALEATFDLLAEGNYTADIVATDFRNNVVRERYLATGDGILLTDSDGYLTGYQDTEDGLVCYEVSPDGSQVALRGNRTYPHADESVAAMLPTFDIDANLFNPYGSSTYTLDGRFALYDFIDRILPDRFLDLTMSGYALDGKADVRLEEDSVVVSYTYEDFYGYQGTIVSTLTNIGTTSPAYDFDALYVPYKTPTSWKELSTAFYDLLVTYVEDPEKIPFYWLSEEEDTLENLTGFSFKESVEKTELVLVVTFPNWAKANKFLQAYYDVLVENGFTQSNERYFAKDGASLFFSYPEVIGHEERSVYLWINRTTSK